MDRCGYDGVVNRLVDDLLDYWLRFWGSYLDSDKMGVADLHRSKRKSDRLGMGDLYVQRLRAQGWNRSWLGDLHVLGMNSNRGMSNGVSDLDVLGLVSNHLK